MLSTDDNTQIFRDTASEPAPSGEETPSAEEDEIDLRALAEEVYLLMKQELRLEQQRLGQRKC